MKKLRETLDRLTNFRKSGPKLFVVCGLSQRTARLYWMGSGYDHEKGDLRGRVLDLKLCGMPLSIHTLCDCSTKCVYYHRYD